MGMDGGRFARINLGRYGRFIVAQAHAQQRRRADDPPGLQPVAEAQLGGLQPTGFGKTQGHDQKKQQGRDHEQGSQIFDLEDTGNEKVKQHAGGKKNNSAERLGQKKIESAQQKQNKPEYLLPATGVDKIMNDADQQHTTDHGVQGRQRENGKDAARGDFGAQSQRIRRSVPAWLDQDPGEKDKFLEDPINKDDQGNAAAERRQDLMELETT